jgi:glycosyltransferase involved in cell wall biosynthesis
VTSPARPPRLLVVATTGPASATDDAIRRQIEADLIPDVVLADTFGADSLDDRVVEAMSGAGGRILRRLPVHLALVLTAWRRRRDYDVVVSWGERLSLPLAAMLALTPRRRLRLIAILLWPFDQSAGSTLRGRVKRQVIRPVARRGMDRLIVFAPLQRRLAAQRWQIPPDRFLDVQWVVDTGFWRPMPGDGDMICSVGREMRDYSTLLSALGGLDIRCHIAAGTSVLNEAFGSEDPRAQNLPGPEALPPGVTVGPMPPRELRNVYARSRLVVVPMLPTESDNGVTTIIEAMAMARPVIATDTAGRPEILVDGVNCVLVPPRDPNALRDAIRDLYGDPDRCARLGAAGRDIVTQRHGIEQWITGIQAAAAELARESR